MLGCEHALRAAVVPGSFIKRVDFFTLGAEMLLEDLTMNNKNKQSSRFVYAG